MKEGEIFQGRYRVEGELGRGSFSTVYLVRELATARWLALKVLHPWTQSDESVRLRLRRESKYSQLLKGPHSIRVYDLQEAPDGGMFMVMEFLQGEDLQALLEHQGSLPAPRAAEIARQILEALTESHAAGILHRDLKPHNIFVCVGEDDPGGKPRDLVKLFDFGIAKAGDSEDGSRIRESTRLTVQGTILGTPVYMSPEQCRGEDLTPASDLYSVGIILYEMLTGHVPFDDKNPVQVMMLHNTAPVPPLPPTLRDTPLGTAVMQALAKDPTQRFATAAEFAAALAAVEPARASTPPSRLWEDSSKPPPKRLAQLPLEPSPPKTPQPAPPTAPASPAPRQPAAPIDWSRYWVAALIVGLLIVLAASIFLLN